MIVEAPDSHRADSPAPPTRRTRLLCSAGIVLLTVVAYAPLAQNDFIDFDDEVYVTSNPNVIQGLSWDNVRWAWTTNRHGFWHPLTWMSLQLDVSLFGYNPSAIHLVNLALHLATSVLLFHIFLRTTAHLAGSLLLGAFFAVHPLHVESVAWAAERKDVLSALFWVVGMAAYVRYVAAPSWGRYTLIVLAFMLGLLAKPMLVTLPCALLLFDVWPLRRTFTLPMDPGPAERLAPRSLGWLVVEKLPLFLLATVFSVVTLSLQLRSGAALSLADVPFSNRLATAICGSVVYLWKTLVPTHLALFYLMRLDIPATETLLAAVLLVAITGALAWCWRTHPELLVGWLWFLGTLFPVSGIGQAGDQAFAWRFVYVPHIGLFVTLIWGGAALARRWHMVRVARVGAVAAVLVCAALTFVQVRRWHDPVTIWSYSLAVAEPTYRAHHNLGLALLRREHSDTDLAEAEEHFREAGRLNPPFANAHVCLGKVLSSKGRLPEAEEAFRRAVACDPDSAETRYLLALAIVDQGRLEEAGTLLEDLVLQTPDDVNVHRVLADVLLRQRRRAEAIPFLAKVAELEPDNPEAHLRLAAVAFDLHRWGVAEVHFRAALPHLREPAMAWEKLGLAHARQGQWKQAEEAFVEGLKHAQQSLSLRGNLAMALGEQGRVAEADAHYRTMTAEEPNWRKDAVTWALRFAAHPDDRRRDGARGWELADQAWQASHEQDLAALEARAAAAAEMGRFDRAIADTELALTRAGSDGTLRNRLESSRDRYRQHKPIRLIDQ